MLVNTGHYVKSKLDLTGSLGSIVTLSRAVNLCDTHIQLPFSCWDDPGVVFVCAVTAVSTRTHTHQCSPSPIQSLLANRHGRHANCHRQFSCRHIHTPTLKYQSFLNEAEATLLHACVCVWMCVFSHFSVFGRKRCRNDCDIIAHCAWMG